MNNELFEIVANLVAKELKMPYESITAEMSVGDVPQWSSIAQMEIIVALQKRFDIMIPIEDLFDLTSVGDLVSEVEKLQHA